MPRKRNRNERIIHHMLGLAVALGNEYVSPFTVLEDETRLAECAVEMDLYEQEHGPNFAYNENGVTDWESLCVTIAGYILHGSVKSARQIVTDSHCGMGFN